MSYNNVTNLKYFADQGLPLSAWNNGSDGLKRDTDLLPAWGEDHWYGDDVQIQPSTQSSFACLGQVLGFRPTDNHYHVADQGAIDPAHASTYVHPNSDDA